MSRTALLSIALVSIGLVALGLYLLPGLVAGPLTSSPALPPSAQERVVIVEYDTVQVADYSARVRNNRRVGAGELLAVFTTAPSDAELAISQAAAQGRRLDVADLEALRLSPKHLDTLLAANQRYTTKRYILGSPSGPDGPRIDEREREMLEMEVWGAEDAIAEVIQRIRALPARQLDAKQLLQAELESKRTELASLQTRLRQPTMSSRRYGLEEPEALFEHYRAVLRDLRAERRHEVRAPVSGEFSPSGILGVAGTITSTEATAPALSHTMQTDLDGYLLLQTGLPAMTALATRVDSLTSSAQARELIQVVQQR